MSIDSNRFLDFATRQVMRAWAARQKADGFGSCRSRSLSASERSPLLANLYTGRIPREVPAA